MRVLIPDGEVGGVRCDLCQITLATCYARSRFLLAHVVRGTLLHSQLRLSVCPSVTLVSHTDSVQDNQVECTPYDTTLFEKFLRQISWSQVTDFSRTDVVNRISPPISSKNKLLITSNISKTVQHTMQICIVHYMKSYMDFHWYQNR